MISIKVGDITYVNADESFLKKQNVNEEFIKDAKINILRSNRNKLLSETDWTQMPDAPLTPEKRTKYANYRQALRDITNNLDDPDNVAWPQKPA